MYVQQKLGLGSIPSQISQLSSTHADLVRAQFAQVKARQPADMEDCKAKVKLQSPLPWLANLYESGLLCDVVLQSADNQQFRCHRAVLAAASEFWQALFAGSGAHMSPPRTDPVSRQPLYHVADVPGYALKQILKACYTGRFKVIMPRRHVLSKDLSKPSPDSCQQYDWCQLQCLV